MVHAQRWEPKPWNKKEVKLRKIMDAKNQRTQKARTKKREAEGDANLQQALQKWMAETGDDAGRGVEKIYVIMS